MDSKRANDITLLNNQIIILDAWNNWKKRTNDNYEERIGKLKTKVDNQTEEAESLKKGIDTLDYGRSLGALILIILCAAFYIVPYFVDQIKRFAPYFAMATVLFVIPYILWARGSKKSVLAHLLYWVSNGLLLGGSLYFISIKDGQPNLYYALFENPRFWEISRYFWYLSLGSIVILVISMIVRKIHYSNMKSRLNKELFECEGSISETNEQIQNLIVERDQLIYNKEKEYFGKYPIALPSYSIPEVQKLLQYMINHRADSIKEAINLNKQDEALGNIQEDVKALRMMQEKTNEEINEMKKAKEKTEEVKEEKEDLVY